MSLDPAVRAYGDWVPSVLVHLLADHPHLIPEAGVLRWTEWGYDDPSPDQWIAITERESGRDELPVTLVAIDDETGSVIGVVGLDVADGALTEDERASRTPWLVGMVVRRDARHRAVGRTLVGALEDLARSLGHGRVWVVTGSDALHFYRACGWADAQSLVTAKERLPSTVLTRVLSE
jgi:GNAT superfamily N-acetyltransferase